MTFSKLQLKKDWTWEGLDSRKPEDTEMQPFSLEYPALSLEAHRLRKPTDPIISFLREVNSWSQQEPRKSNGERSAPTNRARYVPTK